MPIEDIEKIAKYVGQDNLYSSRSDFIRNAIREELDNTLIKIDNDPKLIHIRTVINRIRKRSELESDLINNKEEMDSNHYKQKKETLRIPFNENGTTIYKTFKLIHKN